ncbi:MAG: hypothetical protein QOE43_1021, partial [Gaiellaceae bacterium]|nr:hypothetical protein [Gaiellaceae bacterium]
MVGSLAWPVAVVVIVVILRRPIADVIRRIKALKYKEWQLE